MEHQEPAAWAAIILTAILLIVLAFVTLTDDAGAQVPGLPTMSATWWVATPTPVVSEPVIYTEFVWIPDVRGGK